LRHIDDGDCYQVNLTRRLTTPDRTDPRALATTIWRHHRAPCAALIETADLAVVSASPERFLRVDGDLVETKPIKGTASSASVLARSEKDHAENVMIVDLARNDLGRVCEHGTITVPSLCAVEAHPGLHHLVSTVRGSLRPGTSMGQVIKATFPPASITGAPKPRVMQIIENLEPVRRGVYCGAVGWIDVDRRRADLNVAIRTFTIGAHGTDLGVGAGIVADSRPQAEWAETELKAARLLALAGGCAGAASGSVLGGSARREKLPA
jgi:para-aminobenzoate synthetase component 1